MARETAENLPLSSLAQLEIVGLNQGRPNYLSRGLYDDWSIQDILSHLTKVSVELGRKPTKADLWQRINVEGRDEPSPRFISTRVPFRGALELIGYPNVHSWERYDYAHWGVKYLQANDGNLFTASSIDYLSRLKRGPSTAQCINVFGRINNYKTVSWNAYQEDIRDAQKQKETRLQLIEDGLAGGTLPNALFDGAQSQDEMIALLAKYQVAKSVHPMLEDASLVKDCKTAAGQSFIGSLRKRDEYHGTLTAGDIESAALSLGVYDDIWPRDKSHLDKLRVPNEFMEPKKLALSRNLEWQVGRTAVS
ncbi:MAG: hypothetical protein WD887_01090 [Candidatus Saccharimonadales bacterium]